MIFKNRTGVSFKKQIITNENKYSFFLEYEILMDLYLYINKNTYFFLKGKILIAVFYLIFRRGIRGRTCAVTIEQFVSRKTVKIYFLKCVPIRSLQSVIFFSFYNP